MKLGDFRERTKDLPDSTPMLKPGSSHNYRQTEATVTDAIFHPKIGWYEDFDYPFTEEDGNRVRVVIIR